MKNRVARPHAEWGLTGRKIDAWIAPLVNALNSDDLTTLGSCCGHGKERAYVELAVKGLPGLRAFVERMNSLRETLEGEAWFDVALNWNTEVFTACSFDEYPDWIMLSLTIESATGGAPSQQLLKKIAQTYFGGAS